MATERISYTGLTQQWISDREALLPIIEGVLKSGAFVGGPYIDKLETKLASLCKTRFCIALNSGTDALVCSLILAGVRPGDEVITPPNSFIASTAAIVHIGAIPVFADVLENQNIDPSAIELVISKKTKAIMPVHLTGRLCDMRRICEIGNKYDVPIIEDAAQAVSSKLFDKPAGSWGLTGAFSTHPLKNLNACGDGGFVTTDNEDIYQKLKKMRNHGMEDRNVVDSFGYVSRMDNLQAAILIYRLTKLKEIIDRRRENAKIYFENLNQNAVITCPEETGELNTYHTFVIQVKKRDKLKIFLEKNGVGTAIHYPTPIHKQKAFENKFGRSATTYPICEQQANEILSLPVHQYLTKTQVETVAHLVNEFYEKHS